jgi:hypothetical protein
VLAAHPAKRVGGSGLEGVGEGVILKLEIRDWRLVIDQGAASAHRVVDGTFPCPQIGDAQNVLMFDGGQAAKVFYRPSVHGVGQGAVAFALVQAEEAFDAGTFLGGQVGDEGGEVGDLGHSVSFCFIPLFALPA